VWRKMLRGRLDPCSSSMLVGKWHALSFHLRRYSRCEPVTLREHATLNRLSSQIPCEQFCHEYTTRSSYKHFNGSL
jgi:hypothetical protein